MNRLKRVPRTPFASALLGGVVVAVAGLLAINAGWVDADDDSAPTLAAAPLTEPATDSGGDGMTVNEIYRRSVPSVAYVSAEREGSAEETFSPFGPQERGGTATGSAFVIDEEGHLLTNAHVVEGAESVR